MNRIGAGAFALSVAIAARQVGSAPDLLAWTFVEAPVPVRSRVMACLLGAVGPLAMIALAEGCFARFVVTASDELAIPADFAQRITESQVLDVARYLSQASPKTLDRAARLLVEG